MKQTTPINSIICGDCKDRMIEHIADDSIDLIYMDPPFFSGKQYDMIWGESKATIQSFEDAAFYKKVCGECGKDWKKAEDGTDYERCANYQCDAPLNDAKDVRKNDIETYIGWLKERLQQCYRVLKSTGSIYVHLDWHASHYVKVVMDEIFGYDNFKNNIVWCYSGGGASKNMFAKKHDDILFYTKSNKYTFNTQYTAYKNPNGKHSGGKPYRKEGKLMDDWWADLPVVSSNSKERIGYPTQKSESLLERIIKASSDKGDIVLDCFCGCGTTIAAAQRLGREWIGIDIEPLSCTVQQARMEKTFDKPFPVIDIGKQLSEEDANQATIDARDMDPFAFQNWVVDVIGGKPNPRKTGDDGIDGWIDKPFAGLIKGDLIQVKRSDNAGKNVIKLHVYNTRKYGRKGGLVIAFGFTSGARKESQEIRAQSGITIELLTVKNLLMQTNKNIKSLGKQSTGIQHTL